MSNMTEIPSYEVRQAGGAPIKSWTRGVPFEEKAQKQLENISRLPFIHKWVAAMPDVHLGKGATIGSVVPTLNAIIPAAVGVDIGCGMMAVKTSLTSNQLPDSLKPLRSAIEAAVPHGRTLKRGRRDMGAWQNLPEEVSTAWLDLKQEFGVLCDRHAVLKNTNNANHLGTLGTGNHFIEVCLDEQNQVWFMLHSGSRGVGNRIGTYFIELAKKDMARWHIQLPDRDLAYFPEGTDHFDQYVQAVAWAQRFARINREVMMSRVIDTAETVLGLRFSAQQEAVNCHHNYVSLEHHYGKDVWLTRKGAVSAQAGQLGIIPGSMGARSL